MSQEYTPVDWVDETPNTPGTLINKARLDQMQTAHHYADGFEEVDAVPTADPGVDYHKVVFCTADTTFYRWDGTAWVKDVDDTTKALLEAHEADHANPHVVTKAQVGLGNVDNTSDADKPVSDATASAIGLVQGYLDAHEANTSNPHSVTKSQVGLGNCDNTADLDKPISTATQTALDGKVDKNASITGATKCKITYDAKGLVTAGADLAESDVPALSISKTTGLQSALDAKVDDSQLKTSWSSPVSDTNIPSEKLTKDTLDAKVDDTQIVATWSGTPTDTNIPSEKLVKTSLGDGSVTKIGTANVGDDLKPIKIVGGVPTAVTNDLVSTAGAQTVAGAKTLTDTATFKHNDNNIILANPDMTLNTIPTAPKWNTMYFKDNGGNELGYIGQSIQPTTGDGFIRFRCYNYNRGYNTIMTLNCTSAGDTYLQAPNRAYNASNTSDVVNIALLDAYTPMVRTTGNQSIAGIKSLAEFINYGYQTIPLTSGVWTQFCKTPNSTIYQDRNLILALLPRHCEYGIQFVNIGTRYNNRNTLFNKLTSNSDNRYTFGVIFSATEITWYVKSTSEAQLAIYPILANVLGEVMNNAIIDHYETAGYKFCIYAEGTTLTDADMTYIYT